MSDQTNDATSFRARLLRRERLFGTMVTLPTPAVAEVLARLGFDWLFLDAEHGPLGTRELLAILQAVGDRVPCLVRVPEAAELPIKRALDLGAAGVIVPQVNTAEQAAAVVRFARYAPDGARGVGLARAHGYGFGFDEYLRAANERTCVVVQAEHALAVENIEAIVRVAGVDAVLVGPYDLSASLGRMGDVDHPAVVEAIEHVTQTCLAAGVALGYFGVSADAVRPYVDRGYTLVVAGVDTLLLGGAARSLLSELRR
ncbi:MAG TPA: aldolase/citrate lyase family protein [Gammaproteobacteria bacterium]